MEDRIKNPEVFHQNREAYFQKAWSGGEFRYANNDPII
jgi:hypothetical protein